MANIADNAGIFVGGVLDLFNEAERVVARDGDVAHAQQLMRAACEKVCNTVTTTATGSSSSSSTTKRSNA